MCDELNNSTVKGNCCCYGMCFYVSLQPLLLCFYAYSCKLYNAHYTYVMNVHVLYSTPIMPALCTVTCMPVLCAESAINSRLTLCTNHVLS